MKKCRKPILFLLACWMVLLSAFPASAWSLPGEEDTGEEPDGSVLASPFEVLKPGSQVMEAPEFIPFTTTFRPEAKSALLLELNSNSIVYSLNPELKVYPASLTKIMTCLLSLEYGKLDDIITVTDTCMSDLNMYGSTANLEVGEQMTLENILYCMMLSSANEACNVVAEYFCDDVDVFVQRMNEKAAALGCTGTHFANTHGLHDDNHYTTVHDLAIIARYAWQNPNFRRITSTAEYIVPATNKCEARELVSTNYMINENYGRYYYDKAAGIKTGFTTPAGGCLVSTAKDGNMELLSVVCGCEEVLQSDGSYTDVRFTATKSMFEFGFASYTNALILSKLDMVADLPVANAAGRSDVVLHPAQNCYALLPIPYNPQDVSITYDLSDSSLTAPLEPDQVVGTVTAFYQGKLVCHSDLVAGFAVTASAAGKATEEAKGFFAMFWWLILIVLVVFAGGVYFWTKRTRAARSRRSAAQRARMNRRRPPL